MVLDLITIGLLIFAVVKGISKGLVLAVFSLLAFVIGIAAAIKLSAVTANWLEGTTNFSARWLPLIAFLLVFIGVVFLVNLVGRLFDKTAEWAFLGWANKGGGILFFCILYLLIWSVILFYLSKMNLLSEKQMEQSTTYPIIAPWGPQCMKWIGQLIPIFKDAFEDIEGFFDKLSTGIKHPMPTS